MAFYVTIFYINIANIAFHKHNQILSNMAQSKSAAYDYIIKLFLVGDSGKVSVLIFKLSQAVIRKVSTFIKFNISNGK